jgi:DNA (cytosine-5)-methyltransferase 1
MGLTFFDLFAGVGGFRLGMEKAGHTCVGSCEWDKYSRETYKKNFGSYPEYDDAKDLHPQSLPSFDVLCAGFPCQAFSIAGKRLGFEDTRGTIFFEIARIAKEKRPSYLFLENVKGLLSHDKGRTFSTIISTLDEMGYDAEWQVLNSKYFVPQNRERIFIIGHLRGERTRKVFPIGQVGKVNDRKIKKILGYSQCGSIYDSDGLFPTLSACTHGYALGNIVIPTLTVNRETKRQNGRRFKENGEPAFTVTTQDRHGIFDGKRIRMLIPVECERLQGFPDGWTSGVSDTQRYKQMGNAVTVPVVEYIAKEFRLG